MSHSAKSIDRYRGGGGTGFAQAFESGSPWEESVCRPSCQDGGEQDQRRRDSAGDLNLGEVVAGDGDDGCGELEGRVAAANVIRQQGEREGR